jgi:predicted phage baseplate assembly protein
MLPAPNLDDRTFQSLVDEAKRLVQENCPKWSDHNVSDPGVTLIEACAQMVDHLIYRLNRVPDLHYVKFLELIGVELRPPAAARGTVTFWLSAPQPQPVLVRAETQVATPRTDIHEPVIFSTTDDLTIVPCAFEHAAIQPAGGTPTDTTGSLLGSGGVRCFSTVPQPGDALLIGLSNAVPSCAVTLRLDCAVAGRGIDPRRPPLKWEAYTEGGVWEGCDLESDGTQGLNRSGDVVLHVPKTHRTSTLAKQRAGWLRCRVVPAQSDQPTYTDSPQVLGVEAFTLGGTAPMVHAETIREEVLGRSDGTPGQRFPLQFRPVLPADAPLKLTVTDDQNQRAWTEVANFALSAADALHFRVDRHTGEVQFGPAVRNPQGQLRYFGAVPPVGAVLRLAAYQTGGGQVGNVAKGAVRVLKTSVPYVSRVENRAPSVGGAESETLDDAKTRGPLLLRSRGRAVTAEDFEQLARDVAPEAARVHCVPDTADSAGVRILVVPHVASNDVGRIDRADLNPPAETLERISQALDARRLVGTRLLVQPPDYVWLTAVVSASARPLYDPADVRLEVLQALYRLYHPLYGGPDGTGWPFGRSVQSHEIHAALARISGLDMAREVQVALYPAEADTGRRGHATQRLDIPPTALVYSFEHQVRISRANGPR